jgi:hypothetical protein
VGGKYEALDRAIIEHLAREPFRHPIYVRALLAVAAQALSLGPNASGDKGWRLIDRRLQALRRAGTIRYVREVGLKPRWEVVRPPQSDGSLRSSQVRQSAPTDCVSTRK